MVSVGVGQLRGPNFPAAWMVADVDRSIRDPVTGLGTPNYPKMLELFLSLP